jgi:hypothetical protein
LNVVILIGHDWLPVVVRSAAVDATNEIQQFNELLGCMELDVVTFPSTTKNKLAI